jgi:hypothetical protein
MVFSPGNYCNRISTQLGGKIMPKLILRKPGAPYAIPSEFRDWKWPRDTDEGRTARAAWSMCFAEGRGEMDLAEMPKSVALEKTKVLKPMFLAGFWNVDQTVKGIIEELDPGRHQFVPINLTTWFDKPIDVGQRFLINVYHHQSSIIDDMTSADIVPGYEDSREKMLLNYLVPKVTVDPDKLRPDVHLWLEERYLYSLFISDEL